MPSKTPLEEDVRLAIAGDDRARQRVARETAPILDRHLARFRLTPEDRRDALQNALLRVHLRLDDFRGDSQFTTWLFRVAANEALMMLRKQKRLRSRFHEGEIDFDTIASPQAEDPLAAPHVDEHRLWQAWAILPALDQHVLQAKYRQEMPLEQIARSMGTTECSVRSRIHRARHRLRDLVHSTKPLLDAVSPPALGSGRPQRLAPCWMEPSSTLSRTVLDVPRARPSDSWMRWAVRDGQRHGARAVQSCGSMGPAVAPRDPR